MLMNFDDEARGIARGQAWRAIMKMAVIDALSDDPSIRQKAREWIVDRTDGKAIATIAGDDENPLTIKGILEFVRPD
jgi:hypothetical protein